MPRQQAKWGRYLPDVFAKIVHSLLQHNPGTPKKKKKKKKIGLQYAQFDRYRPDVSLQETVCPSHHCCSRGCCFTGLDFDSVYLVADQIPKDNTASRPSRRLGTSATFKDDPYHSGHDNDQISH